MQVSKFKHKNRKNWHGKQDHFIFYNWTSICLNTCFKRYTQTRNKYTEDTPGNTQDADTQTDTQTQHLSMFGRNFGTCKLAGNLPLHVTRRRNFAGNLTHVDHVKRSRKFGANLRAGNFPRFGECWESGSALPRQAPSLRKHR